MTIFYSRSHAPHLFRFAAKLLALGSIVATMSLSSAAHAKWRLSPTLTLISTNYFDPLSPAVNENLDAFRAALAYKQSSGTHWRINVSPFAQYDPLNLSPREKFYWDVPEGYVEWKGETLTFQAGENLINWAGTDGFNPVDVVNARRYYDPLAAEKIGAPSVIGRWGIEALDIQLIYIPVQAKSQLPGENSRWLPRDIYVPNNPSAQFILPSSFFYSYGPDVELDQALENNFGAHLQFHLGGTDIAAMYFEGSSITPAVVPTLTGNVTKIQNGTYVVQGDSNFILQPNYYRVRVSGLTSTVSLPFNTLMRIASSYTQPVSVGTDIPGWSYNVVLGLEHNYAIGSGTLTLIPQFAYAQHADLGGGEVSSLGHLFDRAGLFGVRYAPSETWALTASALFDFAQNDRFYNLDVSHSLSDHFKVAATGQYFVGAPSTTIGSYVRNNRVMITITFQD